MNENRDLAKIPPEMYLVSQDCTAHCNLDIVCDDTGRKVSAFVTKVENIVVVDMAVRTYCCSLTPSAYYIYCYTNVHTTDDATEEEREFAYDAYSGDDEGHGYMDWHPLMTHIKEHPKQVYKITILPEEIADAIETAEDNGLDPGDVLLEMQREYFQSNCAL